MGSTKCKKGFPRSHKHCQGSKTKVALSLSDAFCVDRYRSEFLDLIEKHVDILFGNETEILSLYQTKSFDEAVQLVQKDCDVVALTRDARGSVVVENNNFLRSRLKKFQRL